MKQEKKASSVPFFARFLSKQVETGVKVKTGMRAGKPNKTLKYPSDGDEI